MGLHRKTFHPIGSPLDGKPIPPGWEGLTREGKINALVSSGIASNWGDANSRLSKHGAASRRYQKNRAIERLRERYQNEAYEPSTDEIRAEIAGHRARMKALNARLRKERNGR